VNATTVKKEMTFAVAMRDFFGYRPDDGLKEFSVELKQLTDADKAEFRAGLEAAGYTVVAA
jgi:hypothetical protein